MSGGTPSKRALPEVMGYVEKELPARGTQAQFAFYRKILAELESHPGSAVVLKFPDFASVRHGQRLANVTSRRDHNGISQITTSVDEQQNFLYIWMRDQVAIKAAQSAAEAMMNAKIATRLESIVARMEEAK